MKEILGKVTTFTESKKDAFLLLLRITVAPVFIQAGFGKFTNFDRTVQFFTHIGIPLPELNAALAAGTELVGGVLLLLGLCTRLVSVPLAFVMLVAILTAHTGDIKSVLDLFSLDAWQYLVLFLVFSGIGAGKWSLDSKLANDK